MRLYTRKFQFSEYFSIIKAEMLASLLPKHDCVEHVSLVQVAKSTP